MKNFKKVALLCSNTCLSSQVLFYFLKLCNCFVEVFQSNITNYLHKLLLTSIHQINKPKLIIFIFII
uniref:Protein-tyrosine-phosphatase n=1 Tax=Strongyloides papillosus TaxID=174720 RepID=A0A0N5CET1_STREA